jgi:hypothetical protein
MVARQLGVGMDERSGGVPIVREPELSRLAAAAAAVLAEFERLREAVGDRPEMLSHLHAANAVRADDNHGRARGLVVQADEMRWSELTELARLAETHLDPDTHAGVGTWHQDCPACQAALAIARVRAHHRYRTIGPTTRSADPADQPRSAPGNQRP